MRDVSGSRFMRMAGSDDFQNKLNRSSQPVGRDFTYESEGGTGANGSMDQDMRISQAPDDGSWNKQVQREKALPRQLGDNGGYGSSKGSKPQYGSSGSSSSNSSSGGFDASNVVNKYIQNAANTRPVDIQALDKQIRSAPLYHEAKGRMEDLNTFGDMYRYGREQLPEYKQPDPMKAVKSPDFGDMYNRTKKDLDDYKV
jgi:hypothetical protein